MPRYRARGHHIMESRLKGWWRAPFYPFPEHPFPFLTPPTDGGRDFHGDLLGEDGSYGAGFQVFLSRTVG